MQIPKIFDTPSKCVDFGFDVTKPVIFNKHIYFDLFIKNIFTFRFHFNFTQTTKDITLDIRE